MNEDEKYTIELETANEELQQVILNCYNTIQETNVKLFESYNHKYFCLLGLVETLHKKLGEFV